MTVDAIARRRTMPPGGRIGHFDGADGQPLRYGLWPMPQDGHGSVVVLGGRGEFIEKHYETYADLLDRGFGVAAMDWRGQGLSARGGHPPGKDHLADYRFRRADLDSFFRLVMRQKMPPPYYGIAHSMGGHILAHHLHDQPNAVQRAVLCSPMIGLDFALPLRPVIGAMTGIMHGLGRDDAFLPGQGPYQGDRRGYESRAFLTSDRERYEDEGAAIKANPALAPGGMTFGWLRATRWSIAALNAPGYPEAIATPMLILMAGDDRLVSNRAITKFAARVPQAQLVEIPQARHELLKENDAIRRQVWGEIMRFLRAPRRA